MSEHAPIERLAVLTSGGDAPGMNAVVRSVVRTGLHHSVTVYGVHEGYAGLVDGGEAIRPFGSPEVSQILQRGGSAIGSARSEAFRTRDGRRQAARNLVERGVSAMVVMGGDGSLTGADVFRREWPELVAELAERGELAPAVAEAHPRLRLVGIAGSIDNDMFGTDMTVGADTALHRVAEAVDAIRDTAASHQRSFVVEVMGRHCGYLALMSAVATGANWVLIPESPPPAQGWADALCDTLEAGRRIGRRQNMIIVAEGAHDDQGNPITADDVCAVLRDRLGEDARTTIPGHVQRGGSPSAFDRYLGTLLGHAAVERLLAGEAEESSRLVGIRGHQVASSDLMDSVAQTQRVAELVAANDAEGAMRLRGGSFEESYRTFQTLTQAQPQPPEEGQRTLRLGILHADGPAPGMNTVVRVASRLILDAGHVPVAIRGGFEGLRAGDCTELDWMSVTEWGSRGGAELGVSRRVPEAGELDDLARQIEEQRLDGLLMVGGWDGYWAAHALHVSRGRLPALSLPIVCLPASINNDLPGSELSIGADTALNTIVSDIDRVKQSAVAAGRCFIVEVMGRDSGYLALLSGIATGAERVYLPERGIHLDDLLHDVNALAEGFRARRKRLGLIVRSEHADELYTTDFLRALFEKESGELFDVRQTILGHLQQGGDPSPFDRVQASRLASHCVAHLIAEAPRRAPGSAFVGLQRGQVTVTDLNKLPDLADPSARRPLDQWWLALERLAEVMADPTQD